jgi:hypothetical protein
MTIIRKSVALVGSVGLALALAAPAVADQGTRPFSGRAAGDLQFVPSASCPQFGMSTEVERIPGTARHLGRMVLSSEHCAGFGHLTGGTMTMVAANGDRVFIEYSVDAPMVPSAAFTVDVDGTIVDGTGRFDGASGHVDMTGSVRLPLFPSFESASISFVWTGSIGY